jgi:hypothetical protein
MRCLPTAHQLEFMGQAVEYVEFAAQNSDSLMWLAVSDGDVEVAAQHKVGTIAKHSNTIENVLHRAYVAAFTDRSVNAEHY